ncbi:MAG: FAD-dependent oxidoreductase [Candidatus Latescibacteria bacterium]|nr:FAD-dependent oxidoreductase [Candidatus Latescibacterota bacterium]
MDILVPSQKVEVLAQGDIVVCGAGCSGVAAAVSAARHGASTILIERWPTVGGMATNALVNAWHRSDREKMVIYGLVEESAQRAEAEGWIRQDPNFPHVHETHWFDPEGMRIVWQRMLKEAGVRVFCYLAAGDPIMEDERIRGVLVDTKRGRRAVLGRIVVDATGDGDVAAKAGVPFGFGREADGLVQGMTLMFKLHGIDPSAAEQRREAAGDLIKRMRTLRDRGQFPPFNEGNTQHHLRWAENGTLWNMLPAAGNPLDEEELSQLTAESRERLIAYLALWRKELPGCDKTAIDQTGFALGVRESRRIRGLKTLDQEMVLRGAKHSDAIGHGVWMIDIHDPRGTGYTTYADRDGHNMLPAGTSYHIPLRMCLTDRIPNLGIVGRCASSTHEAHASVRVQTHCMVMGQGVGTAAAMAVDKGQDLAQVDVAALQARLRADGAYIEDVPTT